MSKKGKRVQKETLRLRKETVKQDYPSSDLEKVIWVFDDIDKDGAFAFDIFKIKENGDLFTIMEKMVNYETMTWNEISKQTHDKGKSKHHFLDSEGLSAEAVKRIRAKDQEENSDMIFSFALTNTLRIIGVRDRAFFHVMWYDTNHQFYPSKRT